MEKVYSNLIYGKLCGYFVWFYLISKVIYLAILLKSIFVDFFKEKRELRQSLTKKQEIYFTG